MKKLQLQDLDLKGKKVLMRVDFNVPLNKDGSIADDTRLRESLPSIKHILSAGGSAILMSHLGRPTKGPEPQLSLAPCAKALSQLLEIPIQMAEDCIGEKVERLAQQLKPGQVLLLENLRFYPAEENPSIDPTFVVKLAGLGDLYVNDAFGTAHRSHSSTAKIAEFFPGKAAAGLLMQKEIQFMSTLIDNPKRPFYAIIGGAKISTKMGVLKSLISKVDGIFIGGGMAFTFFKAQGLNIGDSIHEDAQIPAAKMFLDKCQKKKVKCYLPEDLVIADAFREDAHHNKNGAYGIAVKGLYFLERNRNRMYPRLTNPPANMAKIRPATIPGHPRISPRMPVRMTSPYPKATSSNGSPRFRAIQRA